MRKKLLICLVALIFTSIVCAEDKPETYSPKIGDILEFEIATVSSKSKFGKRDTIRKNTLVVKVVAKKYVISTLLHYPIKESEQVQIFKHRWEKTVDFVGDNFIGLSIKKVEFQVGNFIVPAIKMSSGRQIAWFAMNGKASAYPVLLRLDTSGHTRYVFTNIVRKKR